MMKDHRVTSLKNRKLFGDVCAVDIHALLSRSSFWMRQTL
jgi:hypothetical protein